MGSTHWASRHQRVHNDLQHLWFNKRIPKPSQLTQLRYTGCLQHVLAQHTSSWGQPLRMFGAYPTYRDFLTVPPNPRQHHPDEPDITWCPGPTQYVYS